MVKNNKLKNNNENKAIINKKSLKQQIKK